MNYWLQLWAQSYDSAASSVQHQDQPDRETTVYYLTVYCGLAVLTLALYGIRTAIFLSRTVVAGKRLYAKLFDSVLGARVRFFDITPVGRSEFLISSLCSLLIIIHSTQPTVSRLKHYRPRTRRENAILVSLPFARCTIAKTVCSFLEVAWTVGILATIVAVMPSFRT